MPRRWLIRICLCPGPCVSLGVHIDVAAPLIDLHLPWLFVSIGRNYPPREGAGRFFFDWAGIWRRRV